MDIEIIKEKEKFINDYAKRHGWNPKHLKSNQLLRIIFDEKYKNIRKQKK